ncbi:MAG: glycoside hydrolase family 78 protein [Tannerella sp.]|nr:glycoside hydrolase family 78 protein [Tannerella sp.]
MKKLITGIIAGFIIFASCTDDTVTISEMRCEYMESPVNIDTQHPRFTWTYQSTKGDMMQDAFRLDIATSGKALEDGIHFWTTGRVTGNTSNVVYDGTDLLEPHTKYYWKITSWYGSDQTVTSAVDSFETAIMRHSDWNGQWITDKHDKSFGPAPMFRKVFNIGKEIASAKIYISAAAYYKLYMNGEVPNSEKLDPGYTHYDKRNLYTTIDITKSLHKGENVVATVLGNGFYNEDAPVATWDFEKARWRDRAKMIMEIHVEYTDGTTMIIPTDETWKTSTGPHVYNNIYSGETYDARKEIPGWNKPGFDDGNWDNSVLAKVPSPLLVSQTMPPMRVTKEYPAVSMQAFGDTVFVFDMGINLTGVCNIKLEGEKGTKITLTHGELKKDNGRIEMRNLDIYYKPMKDIEFQTDTYFMKGEGEESFTPEFTYHGFQYVEVKSDRPVKLEKEDLTAYFIHTDVKKTGHFSCSNELLNKIWLATNQSYLCNLHSIPTDCPQREKNGWTADGHVAIDLALLNFDGIKFYEKWMDDFVDNQRPEGNISGIIPSSGWGYDDWIGPVWDAALFIIPDALERYYGDTRAIHKIYNTCVNYLDYLKNRENEEGTVTYGIGDWVYFDTQTPTEYTTTCFYYWDYVLMTHFAEITGNPAEPYKKKAEYLRNLINEKYFNPKTCLYANGSQTAQAVALALGIVPSADEVKVAENLNKMIVENNYHLDFGVLGSKYVPRMLSKYGYAETAYKMATQETEPSWGNWIKLGFTTLAETWVLSPEFRDASVNHVFLGDISAWMVNTLAGINYDYEKRGFEKIIIKPDYIKDLSWVKGEYQSVKGMIKSEWRRNGDEIKLWVTIPANTTATIYTDQIKEIGGGNHEFIFKDKL